MKLKNLLGWSSALCLSVAIVRAQETNQADKFEKQLTQIQGNFEKRQREMRESFEKLAREQRAQIDALKKQLEAAGTNAPPGVARPRAPATVGAGPETSDQLKQLNERVDQVVESEKKVRLSEFNPSIGLVGETVFSYRSKGSEATGADRPSGFDAILDRFP